jgi:predicted amidophosphoribosyltransferase
MITAIVVVWIVVMLLISIARSSKRAARRSRRIPCPTCGQELLLTARVCPACRNKVPLRGAAGMRERLWRT